MQDHSGIWGCRYETVQRNGWKCSSSWAWLSRLPSFPNQHQITRDVHDWWDILCIANKQLWSTWPSLCIYLSRIKWESTESHVCCAELSTTKRPRRPCLSLVRGLNLNFLSCSRFLTFPNIYVLDPSHLWSWRGNKHVWYIFFYKEAHWHRQSEYKICNNRVNNRWYVVNTENFLSKMVPKLYATKYLISISTTSFRLNFGCDLQHEGSAVYLCTLLYPLDTHHTIPWSAQGVLPQIITNDSSEHSTRLGHKHRRTTAWWVKLECAGRVPGNDPFAQQIYRGTLTN